jgi:hypothetical protein
VLVRVLLEELEVASSLSEAAGIAITVAAAQGTPLTALAPTGGDLSGWLTYAATLDHVGIVPCVRPGTLTVTH